MPSEKLTLGQAIDKIIEALKGLDEKTRANAVLAACTQLGVDSPVIEQKIKPAPGISPEAAPTGKSTPLVPKDIRALKNEKNPESAVEMACIVAFYLIDVAPPSERKQIVSGEDMETYFVQAHYPLRKSSAQLLIDAKRAGYFDSTERGSYRLNAVGHNLVAHTLPRKKKN